MWNIGSTPYTTSSVPILRLGRATLLDVGQQVAVAEHRRPRRPGGAAGEDQHGEGVGLDLDEVGRIGSDEVVRTWSSASTPPVSVAMTWRTDGTAARSTPFHAAAAAGSTTTTVAADRGDLAAAISGDGLCGFSGTTTAPSPSAARYDLDEVQAVAAQQRDAVAAPDAELAKPPRTLATSSRSWP